MTRRQTYDFIAEPTGEFYRGLLQLGTSQCTVATLITNSQLDLSASCLALLDRLEPHLIAADQVSTWPGTELLPVGSNMATRWSYAYSNNVASILMKATTRLYAWREPELPEDLALLRAPGNVWLGSIAHEADAWLELTDSELNELAQGVQGIGTLLGPPRTTGNEVAPPQE